MKIQITCIHFDRDGEVVKIKCNIEMKEKDFSNYMKRLRKITRTLLYFNYKQI